MSAKSEAGYPALRAAEKIGGAALRNGCVVSSVFLILERHGMHDDPRKEYFNTFGVKVPEA